MCAASRGGEGEWVGSIALTRHNHMFSMARHAYRQHATGGREPDSCCLLFLARRRLGVSVRSICTCYACASVTTQRIRDATRHAEWLPLVIAQVGMNTDVTPFLVQCAAMRANIVVESVPPPILGLWAATLERGCGWGPLAWCLLTGHSLLSRTSWIPPVVDDCFRDPDVLWYACTRRVASRVGIVENHHHGTIKKGFFAWHRTEI